MRYPLMDSDEEWYDAKTVSPRYVLRPRSSLRSPLYRPQNDIQIKDAPLNTREHCLNLKNYIWNRQTKRFCSRDGLGWMKLACYYCSFYFILGVVWSVMVIIHFYMINKKAPRQYGNKSALALDGGLAPGLGFRPQLVMDHSLIRFRSSRKVGERAFTKHVDNLAEWGKMYGLKDQFYQQMLDCASMKREDLMFYYRQGFSCIFLMTDVKPGPNPCTKPKNYGYNKGRPCVAIKLNQIYSWMPQPYQSKEEVPLEIRDLWQPVMKDYVLIKCGGQYPTDQDLVKQVDHISILGNKAIGGIPTYFYPFFNQPGYRQPYIWAQFTQIESNVLINIVCKAYARNIRRSNNIEDMTGAVHFEIFFE